MVDCVINFSNDRLLFMVLRLANLAVLCEWDESVTKLINESHLLSALVVIRAMGVVTNTGGCGCW